MIRPARPTLAEMPLADLTFKRNTALGIGEFDVMKQRHRGRSHAWASILLSIFGSTVTAVGAESPAVLQPVVEQAAEGARVSFHSGDTPIANSAEANPAGLEVQIKGEPWQGLRFATAKQEGQTITVRATG